MSRQPGRRRRGTAKRTLALDTRLRSKGHSRLVGIDEAGRGPLAGPVVAAAVHLAGGARLPGLDDSKKLTEAMREALYARMQRGRGHSVHFGIGRASATEIDRLNILQATFLAMRRALEELERTASRPVVTATLLVDGRQHISGIDATRQIPVIGGDGRSRSIAAASVLAKVSRDRHMVEQSRCHEGYGFARHKGYGTADHLAALRDLGPCPIHRRSFAPVRAAADQFGEPRR